MKKLYKAILAAGISLGAFSCTPYLDMAPTDSVSDKLIWETTENAEYHVNYLYTYLYDLLMNQCAAGQTEALTDMMKYGSYNYNALCYIPSEIAYGVEQTLSAGYVSTYLGYWGTWYQGIAKTNKAIDCLKRFGQMSDEDKLRLEAEIKFMRASLYFDLMKRYKEIIIYDEDLLAYSKDKKLSTETEGWDFIYNDLKFAADNLPAKEAAEGRINKGMAWAFMTRAMLYAERWEEVKTAAEEVEKLGYGLEADYADAYSKAVNAGNNEAIIQYLFDRTNDVTHSFDFYYTPGGDYALHGETGGGYGTPTQEMVESYELATGGAANWAAWHGTTTQTPPYADLEPRFHATILYNGAQWKGRSIEPYVGGVDGWCQWNLDREPMGRTTTGYYLRKLVDESHDVIAYSGGVQPLTIMRYAEVLLNKAEACYRLDMSAEANEAVKAVRARVGLPYTDKGGSALWDAIRQERKVELAFEGLWYWDLRRWGVAHKQYPEGLSGYQQHGLKIENNGDGTFTYTYVSVDDQDRNFPEKMYRFPMPSGELNNNALVEQYPEWK
ncbi:MAG: RagB/SusD family nutrient uptake outer membrane protein [Bacteroidales bacterium]|nr:RagB/SusD family nutrient uptake outer membrane protein [Bacteroidales bacterium]